MPIKIEKQKVLLVEGKDEESFFKVLLEKNGLNEIQVIPVGGKDQFTDRLPAIKNLQGFDELVTLAIMRDADENAKSAFQSICSVLKNNGLESPQQVNTFTTDIPKIGVFIIPDGKSSGMLESLCLSTVEQNDILRCIASFMECIDKTASNTDDYKKPKNIDKARCRAFLSAMEQDTPSLGVAAQKDYWNLESDKLQPVLDFLRQI